MIIALNSQTQMTCLTIRTNRCDGNRVKAEDISILMRRLRDPRLGVRPLADPLCPVHGKPSIWTYKGPLRHQCGYGCFIEPVLNEPAIKYCGFKTNDAGQVCFLWDDKLLCGEPGRWRGELFVCNEPIGCLDFQLGGRYVAGTPESIAPDACPVPSN